ncbi:MAG: NAD-dependent epimerase/dehydratase family protein [Bacillota bacterium]
MLKGFKGRKILVTGCDDFLGWLVALRLSELGADVSVLSKGYICREDFYPSGCEPVTIDRLKSSGGDEDWFEDILFLEHPVILPNSRIEKPFLDDQLSGLVELLGVCGRRMPYFVYASSVSVYGKQKYLPIDENHPLEPILIYGAAKLSGEYICRASALENGFFYSIVRFGEIYGPGNGNAGGPEELIKSVLKNEPLAIMGSGGQVKSYLYVEDAVEATLKILMNRPHNQILNVAGNECVSTWHLANMVKQNFPSQSDIAMSNNFLFDDIECCVDSGKAWDLIGFRPKVDLETGLKKTFEWLSGVNQKMSDINRRQFVNAG